MFKENLEEMFYGFGVNDNKMFNIYYKKLKNSGVDENIIINQIEKLSLIWKPEYGRKIPSVSEIIGVSQEQKDQADIEKYWELFKLNCCNNLRIEPMEDWVATIKEAIGKYEVEEMTYESEKWVKKEFIRIFPAVKSGAMKLRQDKHKYVADGNITMLQEEYEQNIDRFGDKFKKLEPTSKKQQFRSNIKMLGNNGEVKNRKKEVDKLLRKL